MKYAIIVAHLSYKYQYVLFNYYIKKNGGRKPNMGKDTLESY